MSGYFGFYCTVLRQATTRTTRSPPWTRPCWSARCRPCRRRRTRIAATWSPCCVDIHNHNFIWLSPETHKYYICSLRDVILKIERYLSNNLLNTSISGIKFRWTTLNYILSNICSYFASFSGDCSSWLVLPVLPLEHVPRLRLELDELRPRDLRRSVPVCK